MLQLEFTKVTATLENINLRTEKNGPDKVPAADLKFSVATSADVLAHFSPTLKSFLFNEKGPRDLADGMPLRDSHLVFPLARDEEMTGADVEIEFGVVSDMGFGDVKVNQFRITPMEGGSVVLGMRVQCKPTPDQVAKLYTMQEQGVTLTLKPAELPVMKETDAATA